jgi:hypothetical protein
MTRLIVLTGAPVPSSLQWDENALSSQHDFTPGRAVDETRSPERSGAFSAQWRKVAMRDMDLDSDQQAIESMHSACVEKAIFLSTAQLTQQTHSQPTNTLTSTSVSTASMHAAAEILEDFYDQSLALDEDLTSSQLSVFQSQITSPSGPQWSGEQTSVTLPNSNERVPTSLPFKISAQQLNDVKDIPSAAYLQNIQPQTMTVNLVVGIMALPSPRTVGRERKMQLSEMMVGDHTRAGFEITMWLSNNVRTKEELSHRSNLESKMQILRPRDIVLLRNVALGTYQGRVHGQSLRRDVTKVDLLYRRKLDDSDEGGVYNSHVVLDSAGTDPVIKKAKRVWQWMTDFVGDKMPDSRGQASVVRLAELPPDTQ